MDLVAVEAPATRVPLSGQALELFNAAFRIVVPIDGLEILANHLVQALSQGFRLFAGAGDEMIVDGKRNIHEHPIRGHIICVNNRGRDAHSTAGGTLALR